VTGPSSLVVDASALVVAAADRGPRGTAVRLLLFGHRRHAPHLVDAEIGNVMRKLVLNGTLTEAYARRARRAAERAVHERHVHHGPLGDLAWELRDNVTFYDGLYAALAHHLGYPLVTADRRLARAVSDRQAVDLV
jgi:predicted nucleic acid-binding protein